MRHSFRFYIENFIHLIILISTVWAVGKILIRVPFRLEGLDFSCFRFYTTDSNVLAGIASGLCLLFCGRKERPGWVKLFRFVSTVGVTITVLTVVFFLAPTAMAGGGGIKAGLGFFRRQEFVLHLTTPVLSVIALFLSEQKDCMHWWEVLLGVVPVLIYSLIYLVNVAYLGTWFDWYGFTFGGHLEYIPIVLGVMYTFTVMISFLEWKIKQMIQKKS